MDSRKFFSFDPHILPSKRRLLSGFALGVLASLLVFSLLSTLSPPPSSPLLSWLLHPSNSSTILGLRLPYRKNPGGLRIPGKSHDGNSPPSCLEPGLGGARSDNSSGADLHGARLDNSSGAVEHRAPAVDATKQQINATVVDGSRNDSVRCDIFDGRWVMGDRAAPFYPPGSCPYIDTDFNCHKNGRPDGEFLRWRWRPHACDIPRMNATDFLARLRGKRLIFVGDSLNRNMWESLVCTLRHGAENKTRVYEASGRREFKTSGYYSFRFEDYNCSVDFVRSPFLVREINVKNSNGSDDDRLQLDVLDETASAYKGADIIVFNTGHWWTHEKTSRGMDYYQEGDHVHPLLKVLKAYSKALATWARWVDTHIDSSRTLVVFRGYSHTHFRGGRWNSGGECHKETEPIFNKTLLAKYPAKMRALEQVLGQMKTPVIYLNISRLTNYRKDGHPSVYRKAYDTAEEQTAAEASQDCSHWCLPGVPDTWNELLYASLLINGKGPWKL